MPSYARRHIFLLAATVCLLVASGGVAAAQLYPPNGPSVGVSDSTVRPGQQIVVSGDRWQAGTTVALSFHSDPVDLGTASVRADGSFAKTITIPLGATAGTHDIVASGTAASGRQRSVATSVEVLAVVSAGGGSTAFTGAEIQVWMSLALALFGVGLGLLLVTRRRRSRVLP